MIGAGLWAAALLPRHEIAAMHVLLIGGYGLLTIAIASRVVVTHGGHAPEREGKLVTPWRAALLALALAARIAAEVDPAHASLWLAAAAGCWILAWAGWLARARPDASRAMMNAWKRPGTRSAGSACASASRRPARRSPTA
jgi:uncharacterized protein involved in response to NO